MNKQKKHLFSTMITPRCRYCGKSLEDVERVHICWCSEECKKKDEKLTAERKEKKLCLNCGSPNLYRKDICKECLEHIQYLIKEINKVSGEIETDMENEENKK